MQPTVFNSEAVHSAQALGGRAELPLRWLVGSLRYRSLAEVNIDRDGSDRGQVSMYVFRAVREHPSRANELGPVIIEVITEPDAHAHHGVMA